jgi:hypothetical protein
MIKYVAILVVLGGLYFAADAAIEMDEQRAREAGVEVPAPEDDHVAFQPLLPQVAGLESLDGFIVTEVVDEDALVEEMATRAIDLVDVVDMMVEGSAALAIRVMHASGNAVGRLMLIGVKAQIYAVAIPFAFMADAFLATGFIQTMIWGENWRETRAAQYAEIDANQARHADRVRILRAARAPGASDAEKLAAQQIIWDM